MLGKIYAAIFKMVISHAVLTLSKTWSDVGMHINQINSMSNIEFNCLSKCKKKSKLTHEAYLKRTQENIVIRI